MALNSDSSTSLVSQFKGSSSSQDPYDIDSSHGLYCQNCDFLLGLGGAVQAGTRRGVSQVAQLPPGDGSIPSMDSWYFSLSGIENDYVVYYSPSQGVKAWDQRNSAFVSGLGSVRGAISADWSFDGSRLYSAYAGPSGRAGSAGAEVYGLGVGGPDPIFPNATPSGLNPTFIFSQVTSNSVTTGAHSLVLFFTSRNGYFGPLFQLTPANIIVTGTAFTFSTAQVNPPNNTITVQLALPGPIPDWMIGGTIQIAMTSASNPARFYLIPGVSASIPSASIIPTTIAVIGISDNDLVTGTDVTQKQNYFGSQPIGSLPQFKPSALFQYSSRMGYVTLDSAGFPVVFFSDQNAYQSASPAFHGIYLEGRQIPVQGVSLGGTCYIATLSGLYSTQDNGGLPATWTPPAHVDGSVGVLSASCIQAVGGKVLIASEKGLFLFRGGAFPQIPISYFQASDWNRISWTQPWQIQVLDDSYDKVLRVLAPLSVVITGASNTSPITISTGVLVNGVPQPLPHLFQSGLSVRISGVPGNTAANGLFPITVTSPTTFTLPIGGNGPFIPPNVGYSGQAVPQGANAILTWNYTNGDDPGSPFYSLHAFSGFRSGAMATVRNISTGIDETWWAPANANPGGLIRRVLPTDQSTHQDQDMSGIAAAISALYETSLLPGSQDEAITIHDFSGAHLRISGLGSLLLQVFSLDHAVGIVPVASPINLSQRPGRELLIRWFLRSEQETIQFGSNAIDEYFLLALIRAYYCNSLPIR